MSIFENKIVVITGGSEGIGKALVDIFLQQGAKVATCARNQDKNCDRLAHHDSSLQTLLAHVVWIRDNRGLPKPACKRWNKADDHAIGLFAKYVRTQQQ